MTYEIYKVGGCVRDKLLGVSTKDIDFTFVLPKHLMHETVEEGFSHMETFMKNEGYEIFLSTPSMFTIRARFPKHHIHSGMVADFVMARKEIGYEKGTRRPILSLGTLKDDLERRDFTVNAMAEDEKGNLIDLFGGQLALKRKVLQTPLDPKITMMDDPLRILRALRFSVTKGFTIDHDIWEAFRQPEILEKLRITVSGERIREEIYKMMKHDTVRSIKLIHSVDTHHIPGFLKLIFERGLWLKPTFEA